MTKTKKKSTKRRKSAPPAKRHFLAILTGFFFSLINLCGIFLVKTVRKYPLPSLGFILFLCFSGFLTYHVLYNQNKISRDFFFQSSTTNNKTPDLTIESLLKDEKNGQDTEMVASFNQLEAIINANQSAKPDNAPVLNVVPRMKPQPRLTSAGSQSSILSKEKAQIMRVQAALRSFGNNSLVVNGVTDKQTQKAILAFQKIFALKETGIIDTALLNKMREVGLLENDRNGLY